MSDVNANELPKGTPDPCPMCGEACTLAREGKVVAAWCPCGYLGREPVGVEFRRPPLVARKRGRR